eukprot:351943-Chlamydomonas_euryale.AAC.5
MRHSYCQDVAHVGTGRCYVTWIPCAGTLEWYVCVAVGLTAAFHTRHDSKKCRQGRTRPSRAVEARPASPCKAKKRHSLVASRVWGRRRLSPLL